MHKVIFTLLVLLFSCSAFAQVQVEIRITDKKKKPVKGATILETKSSTGSFTRAKGICKLKLPEGIQTIIVEINHKEYKQLVTKELDISESEYYRLIVTMRTKKSTYKLKKMF